MNIAAAVVSSLLLAGPTSASGKQVGLAKCAGLPKDASQLSSYDDVKVPARYWVDVSWQDGEWQPAERLSMPHHHATRLELTNVAAFPALARHRDGRVRLTIDITSRDIRKVPDHNEWRAAYAATIVLACLPATPARERD